MSRALSSVPLSPPPQGDAADRATCGGAASRLRDLSSKRHLLFDLDGTLVDSSSVHARAYREALATFSPAMASAFDYEMAKGKRTVEVFRELGIAEESVGPLVAKKQAAYLDLVGQGAVVLFPGAKALLEHLSATGRGSFLATGASRRSTDLVLRRCGIDAFFQQTVTADDVLRGKPAGDCFELIVRTWQLVPEQCLVVEDAESGVAAAHVAGLEAAVVHNPALATGDVAIGDLNSLRIALGGAP